MTQTLAAIRTRPTTVITVPVIPGSEPGLLRIALLMWKLQARRVRTLAA
jgi:hypothetical protein